MNRIFLAAAGMASLVALSGCSNLSNPWSHPEQYLPHMLQPYRAPVQQGNLITSEMVVQLEEGMSMAQVQFLLGIPLVRDQFHPDRWDYVYYLLPSEGERQLRRLTVFFNDQGRIDHWVSDPMPTEQQADKSILGIIDDNDAATQK